MNIRRVAMTALLAAPIFIVLGCGSANIQAPTLMRENSVQSIHLRTANSPQGSGAVSMLDGTKYLIDANSTLSKDNKWLSVNGKGFQIKIPLNRIASISRGFDQIGRPLKIPEPMIVSCGGIGEPPCEGGGDPGDIWDDLDFTDFDGTANCDYDYTQNYFGCEDPYFNNGDGFKGNVERGYTYSTSKHETTISCGPASYTDSTRGTFEYSEYDANKNILFFAAVSTGTIGPNTPTNAVFTPAHTANSETAGLFLFQGSAFGPAAACSAIGATTIP